ncbi:hypothetical protein VTO42DRAFT_3800 [Malbranchea cinnamomea]
MAPGRDRILFVSHSEHGQTTVMLSAIHELLLRNEFDIHFASHTPALPRLKNLLERNRDKYDAGVDVPFHTINGLSMIELLERDGLVDSLPHSPGLWAVIQSLEMVGRMVFRQTGEEYMHCFDSCVRILEDVKPALVVVDPICAYGIDACLYTNIPHMILSPLPFTMTVSMLQPWGAHFWKYPAMATAYRYPLPWYLIPANIAASLLLIYIAIASPGMKDIGRVRSQRGLKGMYPGFETYRKDRLHLMPAHPAIDYDFTIPDNVVGCGPIVLPTVPVSSVDPGLAQWLDRRPTILVNLGTHALIDDAGAKEMAIGLKSVLEQRPDLQVLWKLKTQREIHSPLEVLREQIADDRVKIVDWLDVEPISILQHENTICYVHHGGANAFFEACKSGVTHVVLPQWFDTYEMASKAEYLGVGVYASQSTAPRVNANELISGFRVALAPECVAKARQIAEIVNRTEGRVVACEKITEVVRSLRSKNGKAAVNGVSS